MVLRCDEIDLENSSFTLIYSESQAIRFQQAEFSLNAFSEPLLRGKKSLFKGSFHRYRVIAS